MNKTEAANLEKIRQSLAQLDTSTGIRLVDAIFKDQILIVELETENIIHRIDAGSQYTATALFQELSQYRPHVMIDTRRGLFTPPRSTGPAENFPDLQVEQVIG